MQAFNKRLFPIVGAVLLAFLLLVIADAMLSGRRCPECGGETDMVRETREGKYTLETFTCRNCGFAFSATPQPAQ